MSNETPFGLVATPYVSPESASAHYLSRKAAEHPGPVSLPPSDADLEPGDPVLRQPFVVPEPPVPERQ